MKTRVFKFKALLTDKQKQLFAETEELLEYIKGAISILNKAKEEIETELNIL